MWYVYVVKCKDSTYYTGITTNIERRVRQHNGLLAGGARYTSARRPVELAYLEQAQDRSVASKREYQVRKLTRQQKQQLVQRYLTEAGNGQTKTS
jgi:putative endonuclease